MNKKIVFFVVLMILLGLLVFFAANLILARNKPNEFSVSIYPDEGRLVSLPKPKPVPEPVTETPVETAPPVDLKQITVPAPESSSPEEDLDCDWGNKGYVVKDGQTTYIPRSVLADILVKCALKQAELNQAE